MQEKGTDCEVIKLHELLGKKWTYGLLHNIDKNPVTFNKLFTMSKREINSTLLSQRLKKLIEFKVIKKVACSEKECRACYSITKEGEKLKEILYHVKKWADGTGCKIPDECKGEVCTECKVFNKVSIIK